MLISICIACYRSEKTLPIVVKSIEELFSKQDKYDYEIILVNDCSPDNTFGVIRNLCQNNDKITGIDLSRNYGQAAAKMAAFQYVNGDAVVLMDDDGEHPVEGIFQLVDKLNEGYDVVYAHFNNRQHTLMKRLTSNLHGKLLEVMGNKPKGVYRSAYAAWSKTVVEAMKKYKSPFMSIGPYLTHLTTKYANVDMEHHSRIAGQSGYSYKKLFKMWSNIFFSFSMFPLRIASYLGFVMASCGFIFGVYLIIRKIMNPEIVAGFTSILATLLLLGGLILIILGIIGEYIGRIYMTISDMPQYTIRTVVNDKKINKYKREMSERQCVEYVE